MQSRPSEPTSALAALIAGNHRHTERRAAGDGRWSSDAASLVHPFPRKSFALAVVDSDSHGLTPHVFSLGHDEMLVIDALHEASAHALAHGVRIIVVVQPIQAQLAQVSSTWMHAELRAFSMIEAILRDDAALRAAVSAGSIRVVAALLEHPTERVHWIGEHPESDLLARGR
jgi:hypothetical protein